MIERLNGLGGAAAAIVLAALGMFYRHGSLIAGVQQKQASQDETNARMQKWMETTSRQLSDIQVKVGRLEPRNEDGGQ